MRRWLGLELRHQQTNPHHISALELELFIEQVKGLSPKQKQISPPPKPAAPCTPLVLLAKCAEATCRFHTDYKWVRLLQLPLLSRWSLQWWVLEENDLPVGKASPGLVGLVPAGEAVPFWPPTRKRTTPSAPAAASSSNPWLAFAAAHQQPQGQHIEEVDEATDNLPDAEGEDLELSELLQSAWLEAMNGSGDEGDDVEAVHPENEVIDAERGAAPAQHLPGMAAGSDSVQIEPFPPAAAADAEAAALRRAPSAPLVPRVPAEAGVVWPEHGRISYHANKMAFEAHCRHHPQCVLSRTARGRRTREGLVAGLWAFCPCGWSLLGCLRGGAWTYLTFKTYNESLFRGVTPPNPKPYSKSFFWQGGGWMQTALL